LRTASRIPAGSGTRRPTGERDAIAQRRIPDEIRERLVRLALEEPELSPRELAVRLTDTEKRFVSEASVYRTRKAHDLVTGPAFVVIKASDEFRDKTTRPNQMSLSEIAHNLLPGVSRPTSPT